MKNEIESSGHMISQFVTRVNETRRRLALENYLCGTTHQKLAWLKVVMNHCRGCMQNMLMRGEVSPHFDICESEDEFIDFLCLRPVVRYPYLEPNAADDDDWAVKMEKADFELNEAEYAEFTSMSYEKIVQVCCEHYGFEENEQEEYHVTDEKNQQEFCAALREYASVGARLAITVGERSVRDDFLEALRLLQPRQEFVAPCSREKRYGLSFTKEQAAELLYVLKEARGNLWRAIAARDLKPLDLPQFSTDASTQEKRG